METQMKNLPTAAGKSSFDLIDSEELFARLPLKKDTIYLDLACGRGAYSLAAAEYIGSEGKIYAVDLWQEGIDFLRDEIAARGLRQIQAVVADVSRMIPLDDDSIDVCLMATVLHDLMRDGTEKGAIGEVVRVLKPAGILAIIEFKKIAGPPGPPVSVRISPGELETILTPYGFKVTSTTDIGSCVYLSIFQRASL
jgi:ubiquinone/menaquinone biosynthesis C-methylase UbiE